MVSFGLRSSLNGKMMGKSNENKVAIRDVKILDKNNASYHSKKTCWETAKNLLLKDFFQNQQYVHHNDYIKPYLLYVLLSLNFN